MAAQNQNKVSLPVIKRLPKYYRYISDMHNNGIVKVSSSELARMMGTTASQVRQDFNCFGGFGQQGIGYHVDVLLSEISKLLFSEKNLNAVLIGTGRLGRAISGYLSAEARGYHLMAAFDKSEVCPNVTESEQNAENAPDIISVYVSALRKRADYPFSDLLRRAPERRKPECHNSSLPLLHFPISISIPVSRPRLRRWVM